MKIVNSNEFNELIKDKIVLVDFFADWCGPCKMLAPVLEEVSNLYQDKIEIVKVNVDQEPALAQQFGIMSIPNMILFKDQKAIAQKIGYASKNDLCEFINSNINK